MAVEAVQRFSVNQEEAPAGLARFDYVELRPGEGLVGISGEKESRVRDLGHLVVEMARSDGVLGEEVIIADQAELTELRTEISSLNEQLETERAVHAGEIESLKREHNEELLRLQREHNEELGQLRAEFEQFKQRVGLDEEVMLKPAEAEPDTLPEPEESTAIEDRRVEEATPRGSVVVEETEERRGWWPPEPRAGAAALVGAGVLGALLWEVVGERIFGFHDGGVTKREITNTINNHAAGLKHQEAVHHAAEMKAIANARHDELQAIHGVYKEVSRDHQKEMKAIHGLRERMNESDTFTAAKFAIRYPWDWAANKVGFYRATPWLHTLAGKAAEHGHKIRWIYSGRRQILQVDGRYNTPYIVHVLNQYR